MPAKNTTGRVRNTKTSANRNIKLENKLNKVGAPIGYKTGMGSQTKGGKESPIVVNTKTGNAAKIKGPLKTTKENIIKAIYKADKQPSSAARYSAAKNRVNQIEKSKKTTVTRVPVKRKGGGLRGGSLGSIGSGMNWETK